MFSRWRLPRLLRPEPPTQPPTVATPQRSRTRPHLDASPPPPSVSPKSTVSKSPTTEATEPISTQPTKHTQPTTETVVPETPPQTPFSPSRQARSQPSPPQTPLPSAPPSPKSLIAKATEPAAAQPTKETPLPTLSSSREAQTQPSPPQTPSPNSSLPKSPISETTERVAAPLPKETQIATETIQPIAAADPITLPPSPPLRPPRQAQSQPSPPQTPPPSSPSSPSLSSSPTLSTTNPTTPPLSPPHSPQDWSQFSPPASSKKVPKSFIPKSQYSEATEPVAALPSIKTKNIQTINTSNPINSPQPFFHIPPWQARSLFNPPLVPNSPISEITEPVAAQPAKESQITAAFVVPEHVQTPSSSSSSSSPSPPPPSPKSSSSIFATRPGKETQTTTEPTQSPPTNTTTDVDSNYQREIPQAKSQNPKFITAIKEDISKLVQSTDEKPSTVFTVVGDNTGALMHLCLDDIKRGYKQLTSDHDPATREPKAIVNSCIQGINNSMMFNSSVTERSPCVHLGFCGDTMMKNA